MKIVHSISDLRQALGGCAPIVVPTMGNLHDGHLALVARARQAGGPVVTTIFVNRLQFLPHEDFDTYPRTFEQDCDSLRAVGCDLVFAPGEAELYPQPQTFRVAPDPAVADILEGEFRPGFFGGVCTVVLKLFACTQARAAVFGKKDYQQLFVIRRMVQQFALPTEIIALDTVRAQDGLALSSRNSYLSATERSQALMLRQTLQWMATQLNDTAAIPALEAAAIERLSQRGWQPDYMTVRRQRDLLPPQKLRGDPLVILGAARLGRTRLIDNLEVSV